MPVRPAEEKDVRAMLDIYAPYVSNTPISFEYAPPSFPEFLERFRSITRHDPWLVYEEQGTVLGYAYACLPFSRDAYRWCAEPSIYLAPDARGRGIGRALYAHLEDILQKQGYQVLYAVITSSNALSLAFHKKVGYHFLAEFPACGYKFGKSHSVTWLEKRLSPVETPSKAPISWRNIVKNNRKSE